MHTVGGISSCCRTSAGRAEFVAAARQAGILQRRLARVRVRRPRHEVGADQQPDRDATVNPDFGQVEVDPAVVNLTAFETFFDEKRPFFLEGSQIFNNFGRGGSNDFWGFNNSEPQIFYSRRIGRAPQLAADRRLRRPPTATTILGAAKLTGKTARGWSLGLLEAVTSEETARTQPLRAAKRVVEPLTTTPWPVQREVGRRAGSAAGTSVNRALDHAGRCERPRQTRRSSSAPTRTGSWTRRTGSITGDIAGSRVTDRRPPSTRLQLRAAALLPAARRAALHLDPTRTSLSGFTGRVNLNRNRGLCS